MSNKGLVWLAALAMVLNISGCTSGGEQSDGDAVESMESLDATDESSATSSDDALISDSLPEESLGENAAAAPNEATIAEGDDAMIAETPADPSSMVTDAEPVPPAPLETAVEAPAPTESETKPSEETAMASTESDSALPPEQEQPKPKPSVPLQKVAAKPWQIGKTWFNGVYFARPGDTLSSISQTIYGSDETAMLKKGNPTYRSRDPRPGDKVYYSSLKRPDDGENMLTFYEEIGQQPERYVAKPGDNIRKVSRELLGFDGAWKEVWASNASVDSKGALDEGTELRYWAAAPSAPAMVNAEAAHGTPPADAMTQPPPMEAAPPPMPEAPPMEAMNELPPPPPMPEAPPAEIPPAQAMNEIPPPPPMETLPPPPPPVAQEEKKASEEEALGMNEDSIVTLGMVAIGAAGIAALLVVRRRRRQRESENQIGDSTQVGT